VIREAIEARITAELATLLQQEGIAQPEIRLEIPRQKGFGDLSTNVAMTAATELKTSPRSLAEKLAAAFPTSPDGVEAVEIAGPGFLNFRFASGYLHTLLKDILANPGHLGDSDEGKGEKWNFEFVSANPTGPLNVVSARAASVGDALVRIFLKRGYDAQSEYYFNDAGRQVRLLGASVKARINQIESGAEEAEIPEGGYQGEYVLDIARTWLEAHPNTESYSDEEVGDWATSWMLQRQKAQLERFRVVFNLWFKEGDLHRNGAVEFVVAKMNELGHSYEKDDAIWFKGTEFGDAEDRVLLTSEKRVTYRVPDMAYHLDKQARGFVKAVVLLGPDHHGAIITLRAALKALGLPDEFYHAIIVQQVNLLRSGEPAKMSKRAGVMVTLDELVDEVGVDASRFFFLRRKITTPLDFDIELAKKHSDENPVYYVQYAHARICSILRQPGAEGIVAGAGNYSRLVASEELDLLRTLALFPWTLSAVVRAVEPHILTGYLTDIAKSFHYFYQKCRVITEDRELTAARLDLCRGAKEVLKEGLGVIGVEAPEKM